MSHSSKSRFRSSISPYTMSYFIHLLQVYVPPGKSAGSIDMLDKGSDEEDDDERDDNKGDEEEENDDENDAEMQRQREILATRRPIGMSKARWKQHLLRGGTKTASAPR